MVIKLIRAVNCFLGNICRPIKLEIIATGAGVDVVSLTVIGFMRKSGECCGSVGRALDRDQRIASLSLAPAETLYCVLEQDILSAS